jgi:segregation and condensation protein B
MSNMNEELRDTQPLPAEEPDAAVPTPAKSAEPAPTDPEGEALDEERYEDQFIVDEESEPSLATEEPSAPSEDAGEVKYEVAELAGILEALIFVSGDPVPPKRLKDVVETSDEEIRRAIGFLADRYQETGSGFQVMEVAGGYQLRTRPVFSTYVNRFLERKKKVSLSGPALESLAIIAYKQPITRTEIEVIRGVSADGVIKSLLDKRLIKVTGVKDVPGRPNLYGTTRHFLEYFGLNSLGDLPPVEDISKTFSGGSAKYKHEESQDIEANDQNEKHTAEEESQPQPAESDQT